jgi:nicotinamidase-related amidase
VVYVRVDINDFLELPVDEPFRMGDGPFPASLSEIAPSAGFQPGDVLITKRHWGALGGTDLEEQVRSRGVDTVVLAGISTNAGVESTLRQGTGLGYAFVTVEDACSSHDAEQHWFAITNIFPCLSHVRSTSEVLAALAWGGGSFRTESSAKEYLLIIQILASMILGLIPLLSTS